MKILRLANVSQATVSRVLAGDVRVDDAKRTRVQSAMAQVNYQPDVRAQALRRRKTQLIGLVIQRDANTVKDDPFFSILVAEIARTLAKTKFHFCLDIADTSSSQSQIYDELLHYPAG
ncbi:MAG: LacI family DNA-binding transcriptional regulator [Fimbriimonadaceae bacterium]